jgi:hypothetical protein
VVEEEEEEDENITNFEKLKKTFDFKDFDINKF